MKEAEKDRDRKTEEQWWKVAEYIYQSTVCKNNVEVLYFYSTIFQRKILFFLFESY